MRKPFDVISTDVRRLKTFSRYLVWWNILVIAGVIFWIVFK